MTKKSNLIKKIVVFDIDGVLLDSTHRYRTIATKKGERIDLPHWIENCDKCINDKVLPLAMLYSKLITQKNTFVIIATSRTMRAKDYQAIDELLGMPDSLVSRNNNSQKGDNLKINGIIRAIQDCNLYHIDTQNDMIVYEDNAQYLKGICDYFKCKGIYVPSNQGH